MNDNEPVSLLFERKRMVMRRAQERLRRLRENYEARRLERALRDDAGISDRLATAIDDIADGRVETHTVEEFLARLRGTGD